MKGLRVLKRFKNMQRIAMSVVLLVVSVAVFAQYPPSPVSLEKSKQTLIPQHYNLTLFISS